jgi:hypothetical protein
MTAASMQPAIPQTDSDTETNGGTGGDANQDATADGQSDGDAGDIGRAEIVAMRWRRLKRR